MSDLKRMNLRISSEMHETIQKDAERRGLTMNAVVIFALEYYYMTQTSMQNLPKMIEKMDEDKDD